MSEWPKVLLRQLYPWATICRLVSCSIIASCTVYKSCIRHPYCPACQSRLMSDFATAAQVIGLCDNAILEQVKSFRYLGSIITDTYDCRTEITARLGMARSSARSLTSLWKDRSLNLQFLAGSCNPWSGLWQHMVANPGQSMLLTARD